jgi:hypothetical protein
MNRRSFLKMIGVAALFPYGALKAAEPQNFGTFQGGVLYGAQGVRFENHKQEDDTYTVLIDFDARPAYEVYEDVKYWTRQGMPKEYKNEQTGVSIKRGSFNPVSRDIDK